MSAPASSQAADLDPLALSAETRGRFRMLFLAPLFMTWSLAGVLVPVDLSFSWSSMGKEPPATFENGRVILDRDKLLGPEGLQAIVSHPDARRHVVLQLTQITTALGLATAFLAF